MITFDLACHVGHRFEGWFASREAFDDQLAAGLVECPVCGSARVEKRLSAVAVHVGRRTRAAAQEPAGPPAPSVPAEALAGPPQAVSFFRALAEFVEKNFEDVGPRFADEARKIDRGEVASRNIRGTTTSSEEAELREEGVEFLTVPLPKYDA